MAVRQGWWTVLIVLIALATSCVVVPGGRNSKRGSKAILTEKSDDFGQNEEQLLRTTAYLLRTVTAPLNKGADTEKTPDSFDQFEMLSEILEQMGVGETTESPDGSRTYRNRSVTDLKGLTPNHAFGVAVTASKSNKRHLELVIIPPSGVESRFKVIEASEPGGIVTLSLDLARLHEFAEAVATIFSGKPASAYRGKLQIQSGANWAEIISSDLNWTVGKTAIILDNLKIQFRKNSRTSDKINISGSYSDSTSGRKIALLEASSNRTEGDPAKLDLKVTPVPQGTP